MGTHIKEKRSKPKPKSVKSKAVDKNSKRRLAVLGKKQKEGHSGTAIQYVTRGRAVRKLQVSLKDFRRLCILKGIYPREPPNSSFQKTCYHAKDIAYLAHEPLLEKFRENKSFMKKVNKLINRKEQSLASKMYTEQKPIYSVDHLIRERYPRFKDSLADMDDALCLIHLFATLPSIARIRSHDKGENCMRLCREWQLYVVKSRSLRKSFVSVKGIYYQAEVNGEEITWIVPHTFAQDLPSDIDFDIMATFLQFYESLVGFVMYKLYHGLGMRYPPNLNQALDDSGAHLESIQLEYLESLTSSNPPPMVIEDEDEEMEAESSEDEELDEDVAKRVHTLADKMKQIVQDEQEEEEKMEESEDHNDEAVVFADDEEAQKLEEHAKKVDLLTNIFKGFTFFLSREVPFASLEFVIRSFGGKMNSDANSTDITHYVTDRENIVKANKVCEYIQPQWVYDCSNFKVLIPVARYSPGGQLPPHLSPFVNDNVTGYQPEFAKEIEQLQAAAGVRNELKTPALLRDITRPITEDLAESEEDEEEEYVNELEEELGSKRRRREEHSDESESESESETEKPTKKVKLDFEPSSKFSGPLDGFSFRTGEQGLGYYVDTNASRKVTFNIKSVVSNRSKRLAQQKEEHGMREMMMSQKAKKLYGRMQHGIKEKQTTAADLKRKKKMHDESSSKKKRK